MPDHLMVLVNRSPVTVAAGTTVAVAVAISGQSFRTSVTGQPRSALCAMGICYECRVTINGIPHRRSCQILCEPGMDVKTDA
jgi:D-hydroxyproline dehydrogenase subunit gamma